MRGRILGLKETDEQREVRALPRIGDLRSPVFRESLVTDAWQELLSSTRGSPHPLQSSLPLVAPALAAVFQTCPPLQGTPGSQSVGLSSPGFMSCGRRHIYVLSRVLRSPENESFFIYFFIYLFTFGQRC